MESLDVRRRRALYRATHRGTKEMDWLLGRFVEAEIPAMAEPGVAEIEKLIALPDPDLQSWILEGGSYGASELGVLIERIRAFHGIGEKKA